MNITARIDRELAVAVRSAAASYRRTGRKAGRSTYELEGSLVHFLIGYLEREFPEFSHTLDGVCDEYNTAYWPFPHGDES